MTILNRFATAISLMLILLPGFSGLKAQLYSTASGCGLNQPLFDNSCTASHRYFLQVTEAGGTALGTDVVLEEVRIIIQHTWDSDLDITLRSPGGQTIELSTDNGGGSDHYGDPFDPTCSTYTAFNRQACLSVTEGRSPFYGSFRPEGDFADFNDGSDPRGFWMLQMCDDAPNDSGFLKYFELIFSTVTCPVPQAVTVVAFDSTAVQLDWETEDCQHTIIEYGPPGFQPGTGATAGEGTTVSLTCPSALPFELSGLTQLTEYDIYLRNHCTSGGYTPNSCPVTIETNCTTAPSTLTEYFDDQTTCPSTCGTSCPITGTWFNVSDDDFDWLIDRGGTASSSTGPADDLTGGGHYIYTETSGSACQNSQAILESSCLDIVADQGDCHLSFYYHLFGVNINHLELQISLNDGVSWSTIWSVSGDQGDQWERVYLDLSAYHGLLAKFRFVSTSGVGFRGDMALDDIIFYGTTLAAASNTFYADTDGDGFGDPDQTLAGCSANPPSGYSDNNLDCDDTTADIHPNAVEIPCNGVDENCDSDDDLFLPLPFVADAATCRGSSAMLSGNGNEYGTLYWFETPQASIPLGAGPSFTTPALESTTTFYVLDSLDNTCTGLARRAVVVTVQEVPALSSGGETVICGGENVDLTSIPVFDSNASGGIFTYHSDTPASSANQLMDLNVTVNGDTIFYLKSTTSFGCSDEIELQISANALPEVNINATDTVALCRNTSQVFTTEIITESEAPYTFNWSTGGLSSTTAIAATLPDEIIPHTVTVTDANTCAVTDTVWIATRNSVSSAAINSDPVSFCNGNDGSVQLDFLDGTAPFSLQWSGQATGSATNLSSGFTLHNLTQGTINFRLTDSFGCHLNLPNIIVNGPGAVIDTTINITAVTCPGLLDGAIDITVQGIAPTFNWSHGATTEDVDNLAAGIYSLTVTDGACANTIDVITVPEPENLDAENLVQPVSCFGATDGAIFLQAQGGTPPYDILWSDGSTELNNTELSAGNYAFTLTDANTCVYQSETFTITEPPLLTAFSTQEVAPQCHGGTDGFIEVTTFGGTPPYRYFWSNGALEATVTNLAAGNYTLTILDAEDCTFTSDFVLGQPTAVEYITQIQPPACNSLNDGQISIVPNGGMAPYQILWEDGNTDFTRNQIGEGLYTFMLSDARGCSLEEETIEVLAPSVISIQTEHIQPSLCTGVDNGAIDLSISGGAAPYSFLWNDGNFGLDRSSLSAGTYQLTVTDANACTTVSELYLIENTSTYSTTLDASFPASCPNTTDGSLYLSVNGGVGPFQYAWNSGADQEDILGLAAGTYWATITDALGCQTFTDTFTVSEPDPISIELNTLESLTCNGSNEGSIDVQVAGGNGDYLYSWSNGSNTEDLSDLPAGLYQLTVIDAEACSAESTAFAINEPEKLNIALTQVSNTNCTNPNSGAITVTVTGGSPAYEYLWSSGDTTAQILNLSEGIYSLTVTDAQACTNELSEVQINREENGFPVELAASEPVSCHEAADGLLEVVALGGTPPYQYNWSNGTTETINDSLSGGDYQVTLTDANGCVGVSPWISVAEPDPLAYQLLGITDNDCFGASTGSIVLAISGGNTPYTFSWNNGAMSQNINQLPAGAYQLTITDAEQCERITNEFTVEEPITPLAIANLDINYVTCTGAADGSIALEVSGGTPPYFYTWNTGAMTSEIHDLAPGIYTCTVSDVHGCDLNPVNVEIIEPQMALTLNNLVSTPITTCDGQNGGIELEMTGGTPPYTYVWNNGGDGPFIEFLSAGTYQCTITDQQNCTYISPEVTLSEPVNDLILTGTATPATFGLQDGSATISIDGGLAPFSFQWDAAAGNQSDSIATNLAPGIYRVTVTDSQECTGTLEVEVEGITSNSNLSSTWSVHLFPNPSAGDLTIQLEGIENVHMRIYDALGRMVRQEMLEAGRTTLNLTDQSEGVYWMQLSTGRGVLANRQVIIFRR